MQEIVRSLLIKVVIEEFTKSLHSSSFSVFWPLGQADNFLPFIKIIIFDLYKPRIY